MNLTCDMVYPVSGIGYQFYGPSGLLGVRVTEGITSPASGIYTAEASPPNGTIGVFWNDETGQITAVAEIAPFLNYDSSTPFDSTRLMIYEHFESMWVPADYFPVTIEGKTLVDNPDGWGRISIALASSTNPTTGKSHLRLEGICYLSMFVASETGGTRPFTRASDRFAQIFGMRRLSKGNVFVRFGSPRLEDAGLRSGYRQKNAACNFTADCYIAS